MIALAAAASEPLTFDTPWSEIPALLLPAYGETWAMVGIVMVFVVAFGGIGGVLLYNTSSRGLFPHPRWHGVLSWVANMGRSLPFLVLMAAIIPFTAWITGTTLGIRAAVVPMVIAGVPFFARLVQNTLNDLPRENLAVGLVTGSSPVQIILQTQLREAVPGLVSALTLNTISMLEYSAIAGTIGAGGIGYLAVTYGYQRFDMTVMAATIVVLIVSVQLVQFAGDRLARSLERP
ncbi:ABC transporter permease [Micrococcus flavus]|uniref:ABC-type methionine transport system permease subunit n=1 Tax=Micrococcus flavus TaxID=384602 RepID=A0A4Y8WYA9_9MICC|nr:MULTISPECIES: methionine ABC transporter permease [Micrococcus]MBB4883593.1 ABC-type methionine transport system permease subunit [Micrococcus flavus]MCK6095428.1 ABC transporter permease [Micrococcus sp. EYE_212]MCK6171503.1 ABC transporter permease [Micrococcus sp. EYE_162]MDX2341383.1 ABC transporter permease [Micrococcus sp. M4NT]TFH99533.1 ABC transporter permease [Micrococcus flavus]